MMKNNGTPRTEILKPRPPGNYNLCQIVKLRMNPGVWRVLKSHAFERKISANSMAVDVLQAWVSAITDPNDPTFSPEKLGLTIPEMPPERYPGYLSTLGFDPEEDEGAPPLADDPTWRTNGGT